MKLSALDDALWAAGFAANAALFLVLLVRRHWRKFPVFSALAGYQVLVNAILFMILRYGTRHAYTVGYWTVAAGDVLLQLALIFEIARVVLRPTGTWVRDARFSFIMAGVGGAAVALVLCLTVKPLAHSALGIWEIRANLFTALLDCELFLAMLYASNRLGLEWRNHVMGLAQGLTIWAFGAVVSDIVHIIFGWSREFVVLDQLLSFLYLGVLVYWVMTFWRPERERAPLSSEMRDYLVDLHSRVQYDLETVGRNRNSL